jgi:hypothetical protein
MMTKTYYSNLITKKAVESTSKEVKSKEKRRGTEALGFGAWKQATTAAQPSCKAARRHEPDDS